jgi:Ca2+:H+ antiporter
MTASSYVSKLTNVFYRTNTTQALGGAMIVGGIFHREQPHNSTVAITLSSLAQIGPFFSILLYVFYFSGIEVPGSSDVSAAILTISRAAAVVSLIIYLLYLYFRTFSHRPLFEPEVDASDDEAQPVDGGEHPAKIYVLSMLIFLVVFVLLLFVAEDLSRIVTSMSPSFQGGFGLLIAPIAIKIWTWLELLQRARRHYFFDPIIEWTVGASIHMSLLFGPVLVLLGQAQDVPLTLHFGLLETFTYGLTSLLLTSVLPLGSSNYLKGIVLVWTYLLLALANILNSTRGLNALTIHFELR